MLDSSVLGGSETLAPHTLMPETIEVSTATSTTRSQPSSAAIVGDVQNELMAADKQRGQQFLLISRRTTTTTVFANNDTHDEQRDDDGGAPVIVRAPPSSKQVVRRQLTCRADPTIASPAMETHFEWRQQDRGQGRGRKGPVLLLPPSLSRNDKMLLGGGVTGTNKIRLKIVW